MLPLMKTNIVGRRYELHEVVGHGGMGEVYRAVDRLTGESVALKRVISSSGELDFSNSADANDFRLALAQEFKLLASVRHPHVIEVLDYGFDSDQLPYYTMELLQSPRTLLEAGRKQPLATQLQYIVQTLQALAYLHRRGILHRDLKPANVLVVDGQVKVLDFGLSVMRDRAQQEEDSHPTTAGTLGYMAPEVLVGHPATELSDLYAVGMMLYELLADQHPFTRHDIGKLVNEILYTIPDVGLLDVDAAIAAIIQRLLQKEPTSRYGSAQEIIAALNLATKHPIFVETSAIRESYLQAARLVGRDSELKHLSDALHSAIEGKGSIWLIAGESGVGKSRLVDEIRTRSLVEGALVMRGQSVAEGRSPFQMWRPILRWIGLLADLDETDAGLIKLLVPDIITLSAHNVTTATELDPETAQGRLLQIIRTTLENLSQPVVMLLEDLHWANSESLTMLARLEKIVHQLPLLIIASYRDDERPDLPSLLPQIPVLKLSRLDEHSIEELSHAMLGEAGKQNDVINLLKRETEGNVFFLIEVVRALAEEAGDLHEVGRMTLPENVFAGGVEQIIRRRLDRIPDGEYRRLLRIAAVIGRQQDLTLLHALEPDADIDRWLTECANAAVFDVQDGGWRFAHDRLRDGVLTTLQPEDRQKLHRRVAETIERLYEARDYASALAYHWRQAANPQKEQYYVILAGEQALRSGAYREAVTLYDRALALIEPQESDKVSAQNQRVFFLHRKAEAHLGFAAYADAEAIYRESLQICEKMGDQIGTARTLYSLGDVFYATGDNERAREHYQDSLTIYQKIEDKSGIAKVLNSLGNIAYEMGDDQRAKQLYQRSLNLSREVGDQWGMAGSLTTTEEEEEDSTHHFDAMFRATQTLEMSISEDNKQGMASALYEMGTVALELKDHATARHNLLRALTLFTELDSVPGRIQTLERLGTVYQHSQNTDEAEKCLRRALDIAVKANEAHLALQVLLSHARLHMVGARRDDAFTTLAFIINYHDASDALIDEAERMVFELESEMHRETVEKLWEQGKNMTLELRVQSILSTP